MKLQYQIRTHIQPSGNIVLDTVLGPENPIDGMYTKVSSQLVQMQDEAVRAALVRLGWTPPAQTTSQPASGCVAGCARVLDRIDRDVLTLALVERGYLSRPPAPAGAK